MKSSLQIIAIGCLLLNGCASKPIPRITAPSARLPYLDLQAGWRLSVVSPMEGSALLSDVAGSARVVAEKGSGEAKALTVEMEAPENFGYVQAWVLLRRARNGVAFHPDRAQKVQGEPGESVEVPPSLRSLFPKGQGVARLLFLTREAAVENDMAVLQAATSDELDDLTDALLGNPMFECAKGKSNWCAWVPRGVAIRVEKQAGEGNAAPWVPVL